MSRLKIKKGVKVSEETFEKFGQDLTTFLEAFPFRLLAEWWGKNKGNLSRKLNGYEAITRNDIVDFYRKLGAVLGKLENGVESYQIELEMSKADDKNQDYKNLWEEIRLLKEAVRKHEEILAELRAGGRRFGG